MTSMKLLTQSVAAGSADGSRHFEELLDVLREIDEQPDDPYDMDDLGPSDNWDIALRPTRRYVPGWDPEPDPAPLPDPPAGGWGRNDALDPTRDAPASRPRYWDEAEIARRCGVASAQRRAAAAARADALVNGPLITAAELLQLGSPAASGPPVPSSPPRPSTAQEAPQWLAART